MNGDKLLKIQLVVKELFYALSLAVVVLGVLELVFPRLVLAYINFNILLLFWLVFAMAALKIGNKK